MKRSFRFLLQFLWPDLGVTVGFAGVVVAGFLVFCSPGQEYNVFQAYIQIYPLLSLIFLLIFSWSLTGSTLNVALSFGARRRDYFWALQLGVALLLLVNWVTCLVLDAVPGLVGWQDTEWMLLRGLLHGNIFVFPLSCLATMTLGCLMGLMFSRSKTQGILTVVIAVVTMLILSVAMIILLVKLGQITQIVIAVLFGIAVLCECLIHRMIRRVQVR